MGGAIDIFIIMPGEQFIHSIEAHNEHLLSAPLRSLNDALRFIYLIYQSYCICVATKGLPERGVN